MLASASSSTVPDSFTRPSIAAPAPADADAQLRPLHPLHKRVGGRRTCGQAAVELQPTRQPETTRCRLLPAHGSSGGRRLARDVLSWISKLACKDTGSSDHLKLPDSCAWRSGPFNATSTLTLVTCFFAPLRSSLKRTDPSCTRTSRTASGIAKPSAIALTASPPRARSSTEILRQILAEPEPRSELRNPDQGPLGPMRRGKIPVPPAVRID